MTAERLWPVVLASAFVGLVVVGAVQRRLRPDPLGLARGDAGTTYWRAHRDLPPATLRRPW